MRRRWMLARLRRLLSEFGMDWCGFFLSLERNALLLGS
jgi:hypothetical protein